jgi:hypothetical protein
MREKLIELQLQADIEDEVSENTTQHRGYIADLMIANGVTVREKGEWDDSGRYQFTDGTKAIRCTECGCALTEIEYQKYFYNFCPVCGADMRGEEHD